MIKFFLDFIDESYLYSNNAPLYHFTNTWSLNQILNSNELFVGHFDHKIDDRILKIISLTRNKNFDCNLKKCLTKDIRYLDQKFSEAVKSLRVAIRFCRPKDTGTGMLKTVQKLQ